MSTRWIERRGPSLGQRLAKRTFDVIGAALGLALTAWIIALATAAATVDTKRFGMFRQIRVGRHGQRFSILKIRTMRPGQTPGTNVTTSKDPRVTPLGRFLRRTKIDELPQLLNILAGHMSFVGPRPDVPGFADCLEGRDRIILEVRPGITGPATLRYRDEEELLALQDDPERFNREVLFPAKVRFNRRYVENLSFWTDIRYIVLTVLPRRRRRCVSSC